MPLLNAPLCILFSHSFILLSVLRQRLFQSQFSTEGDLVLPLSVSSILSFPEDLPVAAYVFFLVFLSLLSFPLPFLQNEFCTLYDHKIKGNGNSIYKCKLNFCGIPMWWNITVAENGRYMHSQVHVWIHSDRQKRRRSTKKKWTNTHGDVTSVEWHRTSCCCCCWWWWSELRWIYIYCSVIRLLESGHCVSASNTLSDTLLFDARLSVFLTPVVYVHAVAQSVEVLLYKTAGRGFDSRFHWNFSLT